MSCHRQWEAQAVDEGRVGASDVAAFERHAKTCAACRGEVAALAEVRALVGELPGRSPSELELRRLRGRVLRDAMQRSAVRAAPPNAALVTFLVAAAAILVVVFMRHRHPSDAAFAASVTPVAGAVSTQTREAGVERVALTDGKLAIRVRKLAPDERFLVMLPDGEIEVRGTAFDVAVHEGQTQRVHVDEGVIVLRLDGGESTLAAGQTWERPAAPRAIAVPVSPPALASGAPRAASAPDPAMTTASPGMAWRKPGASSGAVGSIPTDERELLDYQAAVGEYRRSRFDKAADLLHRFQVDYPASSFADDASFLEASSLAAAGRSDAAALLAERHLARFPASFHKRDASILVARLYRDRGDCGAARRVLAPWASDGSADSAVKLALGSCAPR